jgi:hypothetical protein
VSSCELPFKRPSISFVCSCSCTDSSLSPLFSTPEVSQLSLLAMASTSTAPHDLNSLRKLNHSSSFHAFVQLLPILILLSYRFDLQPDLDTLVLFTTLSLPFVPCNQHRSTFGPLPSRMIRFVLLLAT